MQHHVYICHHMLISIQLQVLTILLVRSADNLPNRSLIDPKNHRYWCLFEETIPIRLYKHVNLFSMPEDWDFKLLNIQGRCSTSHTPNQNSHANPYQTNAVWAYRLQGKFVCFTKGPGPWDSKRVHHHEATWAWDLESGDFQRKGVEGQKNGRTASMRCIKYKPVKSYVPGSKLLILRDDQPTFKKGTNEDPSLKSSSLRWIPPLPSLPAPGGTSWSAKWLSNWDTRSSSQIHRPKKQILFSAELKRPGKFMQVGTV